MVIDRNVEPIDRRTNILTVAIFQLLRLENLYKEQPGKEDRKVITINRKYLDIMDVIGSFQNEKNVLSKIYRSICSLKDEIHFYLMRLWDLDFHHNVDDCF